MTKPPDAIKKSIVLVTISNGLYVGENAFTFFRRAETALGLYEMNDFCLKQFH